MSKQAIRGNRKIAWTDKSIAALKPEEKKYEARDAGGTGRAILVRPTGKKVYLYSYRFDADRSDGRPRRSDARTSAKASPPQGFHTCTPDGAEVRLIPVAGAARAAAGRSHVAERSNAAVSHRFDRTRPATTRDD